MVGAITAVGIPHGGQVRFVIRSPMLVGVQGVREGGAAALDAWNELHSRDGRMLFLCFRSYKVANYPRVDFNDDIYFLDDRKLYHEERVL
ncbi:hypothetical protein E2562_014290 [Oryza meyeriana var. granulata]|uniref:DUF295 domain-containing protein n=1 Tax=Oryza meyeriana var. granulata TaxID=110450 RepID=A0A6G1C6L1_9ORYZ|nr:hypothetical protein E2562_014290 [Oryza meyeriana var. granulata]